MGLAIAMADHCQPADPARIPRVGAVIVADGEVIATGYRAADDHAEKIALSNVRNRDVLMRSTVFTRSTFEHVFWSRAQIS
jgi:pyrimidine deaminase RibD-like protein